MKMMLCVMMLPLVVVGCTSKQSVSQCVKPPPPPAWIMQPPTGRHRWTGLFHPQREAESHCKNNWKEPEMLLMTVMELPISMRRKTQPQYCEQYTRASSGYKCLKVIKPSNPFYECLLGFCFNNIFCAAGGCIDSFLLPIPETKKWWVMVSFSATAAGLFWTVNVCWAHPVISRASAVAGIFSLIVIPDALVAESYVRKLNKP